MSSCLNDSAVSSPTIRFYSQMYRTSPEGVKDTLYLVDTVRIGDTLRLPVLLQGGYNILTSFQVSSDPLDHMVKLEVDSAVATIVDPKSDLEKGKLVFPQDRQILMCNVTVCFIPQRAGSQPINLTLSLPLTVVSLTLCLIRWRLSTSSCSHSPRFVSYWLMILVQVRLS